MSNFENKVILDNVESTLILAAYRFNETVEDGQKYDVEPEYMIRLDELGLVEHKDNGFYMQTDLMIELKDQIKGRAEKLLGQVIINGIKGAVKDNPLNLIAPKSPSEKSNSLYLECSSKASRPQFVSDVGRLQSANLPTQIHEDK